MGRYQELLLTNRQYAFARHGEHSLIITALNNDDNEAVLNIPVPMAASQAVNLLEDGEILPIRDGKLQITLKGCDGAVLKIKGGTVIWLQEKAHRQNQPLPQKKQELLPELQRLPEQV